MRHRALDGWRGVGALAVAVLHLKATGFLPDVPPLDGLTLAVDFFFVLSGFVIARVYTDDLSAGGSPFVFVIRRFGRLWPLHVVLLLALVAIELLKLAATLRAGLVPDLPPFSAAREPAMILPNVLLIQAFLSPEGLSWNYPSWSISAEFWTYLIFALAIIVGPSRWSARLALFGALVLVAWLALLTAAPDGMETTGNLAIARCLTGFFTGAIVERLYSSGLLRRLSSGGFEIPAAACAILLILASVEVPLARFAAPVVFALLVMTHADDAGPLSRLLGSAPLQWLGKLSYSIYMTHALLLAYVMPRLAGLVDRVLAGHGVLTEVTVAGLFVLLLLAVSALTYRFVELPGQRIFSSLARQVAAPAPLAR
jgi:peptidoglycan/LPS O-acetylase OafA/YrhL